MTNTDHTNKGSQEDPNATWISDKDAEGKDQRVKSEDYAAWRQQQDQKAAEK